MLRSRCIHVIQSVLISYLMKLEEFYQSPKLEDAPTLSVRDITGLENIICVVKAVYSPIRLLNLQRRGISTDLIYPRCCDGVEDMHAPCICIYGVLLGKTILGTLTLGYAYHVFWVCSFCSVVN